MYWNILLVRTKPAVFPHFFIFIYLQHDASVPLVTTDKVTGSFFLSFKTGLCKLERMQKTLNIIASAWMHVNMTHFSFNWGEKCM